jgi:translation initiation factor IF-3
LEGTPIPPPPRPSEPAASSAAAAAAAGQGPKQDPRRQSELRVNRRIRVKEVFVIASDGTKLGILPTEDALKRAMEEGLDLVEVNPMSRPPVCKLMDYGKYKYDQKKKAAAARKNQKVIEVKEVKLRPKTDHHDFDFKVNHIREFLGEGNKAKVTIMFRGREITHPEIGRGVLDRVVESLKDVAMIELYPRMEGRNMFMVLAPGKPGQKPATLSPAPAPQGGVATSPIPTPLASMPVEASQKGP